MFGSNANLAKVGFPSELQFHENIFNLHPCFADFHPFRRNPTLLENESGEYSGKIRSKCKQAQYSFKDIHGLLLSSPFPEKNWLLKFWNAKVLKPKMPPCAGFLPSSFQQIFEGQHQALSRYLERHQISEATRLSLHICRVTRHRVGRCLFWIPLWIL